jgi:alpha-glucosidase
MQWSTEPNAGFTTGEPWLPVAADFRSRNVAAQRGDPASMLALYEALLRLRRGDAALEVGGLRMLQADGDVLAYLRLSPEGTPRFLVALNFGPSPQRLEHGLSGVVALTTFLDRADDAVVGVLELRPDEGVVVRLG